MRLFLLVSVLSLSCSVAQAGTRNAQISWGGGGGIVSPAPWMDETVKPTLTMGPRGSFLLRFYDDSSPGGFEFAYDYLNYGTQHFKTHNFTVSYFWRYMPESTFHPIWEFGLGICRAKKFYTSGELDLAVFRQRVGVDIEIEPQIELGIYLDHFAHFKNKPTDPNVMGFAPMVAVNFYFDKVVTSTAAPAKEEAKPAAPAPTPTAPAAPPVAPAKVAAKPEAKQPDPPQKEVAKPKAIDSDKDGIPDALDLCPETRPGVMVDKTGCSVKKPAAPIKKVIKKTVTKTTAKKQSLKATTQKKAP